MKNYLLFIGIIIIFTGCQNLKKEKDSHDLICEKIETELSSGVRNDTIFLNFRFGMDRNEVSEHVKKLINEGRLTINRPKYEYLFDFGENILPRIAKADLNVEYFDDKLYRLILYVTSDELISSPSLIQIHLASVFRDKYGYNYLKRPSVIDGKEAYVWIHGNMKIEVIAGIDDARVFYTDLVAMKKKEKFDELKSAESKERILNDI